MAAGMLLLFGGVAAAALLLTQRGKEHRKFVAETESKAIGAELVRLPEESRNFIFRLLLTDDPANDAGVYASAIVQMTQLVLPATAKRLTQIAKERFG